MSAPSLLFCLWPGLPQLWWRGEWRSLFIATGYAVALNLFWLSTFVWPELLPASARIGGWIALFAIWAGAVWHGRVQIARLARGDEFRDGNTLFIRAQTEYLQGHWYESEALLRELAGVHHRDADCRLMLAALLRRTERYEEARTVLDKLDLMETADRWRLEVSRERHLLDQLEPRGSADVQLSGGSGADDNAPGG